MLYRFFRSYNPLLVVLIPIIGILLWLNSFIHIQPKEFLFDKFPMPFYRYTYNFLGTNLLISSISTFFIIIIQSFLLVRINLKYILIQERTYLPALMYILLVNGFIELHRLNPALFGSLFIILAIDKIFDSYKKDHLSYSFFDASILLSIGSLFYFNTIYFLLFLWLGLLILRPFIIREWIFTIIGFAVPYIIYFGMVFVFSNNLINEINSIKMAFSINVNNLLYMKLPHYIYYTFMTLLVLIATFNILNSLFRMKVQNRNFFQVLIAMMVISMLIYILIPSASVEMIMISSIPFSFILSHYFRDTNLKWWGELIFVLILGLQLFINIY